MWSPRKLGIKLWDLIWRGGRTGDDFQLILFPWPVWPVASQRVPAGSGDCIK